MNDLIIRYFLKLGGKQADKVFTPYVWGQFGIKTYLEAKLKCKKYGNDLQLLLVQYYVESEFKPSGYPEHPIMSNYSNKNKDIAVAFPVSKNKFQNVCKKDRRQFIVDTTLQAIEMVEGRLGERKLDIDFDSLRKDFKKASEIYLKQPN